jgi:hypothetical protein
LLGVFLGTEGGQRFSAHQGIGAIHEIEPFDVGRDGIPRDRARWGRHVFICNIYDKEENEDHYPRG